MKILKVIHGYPMRYNAGSEVYSQTLCLGLAERGHSVDVFTREEDSFAPDFNLRTEQDQDDKRITVHLVNNPRMKDRYRVGEIDRRFAEILEEVKPDIVHFGHLNHLSTGLVEVANSKNIPIVFTLHDYWLMCPRGQFMQFFSENENDIWACCQNQKNEKCAKLCYARYFTGESEHLLYDFEYWTNWIKHRMKHTREITKMVDIFIAPAKYLYDRFHKDFDISENKLVYLDYGFDLSRFGLRTRTCEESFVFGYIGTHIPAKGIHILIQAFGRLKGNAILRIWGRPRGQDTEALKSMASTYGNRIEWLTEYKNQNIVEDVFNFCDSIVVPSVWVENSPLVIHEAQQARVPVITANVGGMAEYVRHEENGLLFEHRSIDSLAEQMQKFVDNPEIAKKLGNRGYLFSENGDIPDIGKHIRDIEGIYQQLLGNKI
jgi:glycosyltransferase involved in cell wall biosynthesis